MFRKLCCALINLIIFLSASLALAAPRKLPPIVNAKPVHLKLSTRPLKKYNSAKNQSKITVILDPGHGGRDAGATGRFGLKEKALNLQIAKLVKRQLESTTSGRLKVVLTRSDDRYLTRQQRINVAKRYHAKLLVSLHADTSKHADPCGVTIYTLSPGGFKTISQRWLANQGKLRGLLREAGLKDSLFTETLTGIASDQVALASSTAGKNILAALKKTSKIHKPKLIYADFWILKAPHVPSVLIEVGFISNRSEAMMLNSDSYQAKLAEAISLGIKNYFKL